MANKRNEQENPRPPVAWDEIPESPADNPFMVLAEGEQGAGKTHFAMTFPEPIFLLDTENRADKVAAKFKGSGKQVYRKKCLTFDDIRQAVAQLIFAEHGGGTIVIDSGSDLQAYAETEFLRQNRKEKIWPQVLWGEVHAKTDNLLAAIRDKGFYCVITGRLKEEYIGEYGEGVKSGNLVLEGYRKLPYRVDIFLRLTGDGKAIVQKNGFRNTPAEEIKTLDSPSFETVIKKLVLPEGEDPKEKVKELKAKTRQKAPKAKSREPEKEGAASREPKTAQDEANVELEGKDTATVKNTPSEPSGEVDREATREEIAEAFTLAKKLEIEPGTLKLLLFDIKGEPSTDGITMGQLKTWVDGMKTIAEEYKHGVKTG